MHVHVASEYSYWYKVGCLIRFCRNDNVARVSFAASYKRKVNCFVIPAAAYACHTIPGTRLFTHHSLVARITRGQSIQGKLHTSDYDWLPN